jgi:hypothetical protein
MDSASIIAGVIGGAVLPFAQEILVGAKISGRAAAALTLATSFAVATFAFWATGGFGTIIAAPAFDLVNPRAFFEFWLTVWAPVYGISQAVYSLTTKHAESPPATGPIQTVADKVQPVIGTD